MSKKHRKIDRKRWAITRRRVFERDGYRCRSCGRAGRLECDHIVPLHLRPDDENPYDIAGLQSLCRGCHLEKTRREVREIAARNYPQAAAWRKAVDELM